MPENTIHLVIAELPQKFGTPLEELKAAGPLIKVRNTAPNINTRQACPYRMFIARLGGSALPKGARVMAVVNADGTSNLAASANPDVASAVATLRDDVATFGMRPLERVTAALTLLTANDTSPDVRQQAVSITANADLGYLTTAIQSLRDTCPSLAALAGMIEGPRDPASARAFVDATWEEFRFGFFLAARFLAYPEYVDTQNAMSKQFLLRTS